jgi:hypothetical protein
VGTSRLILKFGLILDLKNSSMFHHFLKIWFLISRFCDVGYGFLFDENVFSILKTKLSTSGGTLINVLYKINLDSTFKLNYLSMHVDSIIKRSKMDENSFMFWYKRLDHIFIEIIKRLVNDIVLNTLNFIDFGTCVDCIKG